MKYKGELLKDLILGVDRIKIVVYVVLIKFYSKKYQNSNSEFYKTLATTSVNEIFGQHNKNSEIFFKDNKDEIIEGIITLGINYQELKQPITDALRILSVVRFQVEKIHPEHYINVCNNAMERGVFINGGDKPNPALFLRMAVQLANDYGVE